MARLELRVGRLFWAASAAERWTELALEAIRELRLSLDQALELADSWDRAPLQQAYLWAERSGGLFPGTDWPEVKQRRAFWEASACLLLRELYGFELADRDNNDHLAALRLARAGRFAVNFLMMDRPRRAARARVAKRIRKSPKADAVLAALEKLPASVPSHHRIKVAAKQAAVNPAYARRIKNRRK